VSTESTSSRLPRSNSVNRSDGETQGADEKRSYQDEVIEQAAECVAEFYEEYPELAAQPLSRTPGQTLRKEVVDEQYIEERVEPVSEFEQGHVVQRLDRAEAVTWAEALFTFLVERQPYDDGLGGVFRDQITEEQFTVQFGDCWTPSYGEEKAAEHSGAERQLMGGRYPDEEESMRTGEQEDGLWSNEIATVVLTRTGSSRPGEERVPPVDFLEEVARTWSQGGVRETVRNICEYHLGLEPDQWGFIRGDDVHGISRPGLQHDDEMQRNVNACYPHCHDVIYFDLGAADVGGEDESEVVTKDRIQQEFGRAIEKHLAECELAGREAHRLDKAVRVRLDLEHPAGYATEYLRLDDEPMMEAPVELQAFAAVEWANSRKRFSRSTLMNEAAKADFCKQNKGAAHGHRVVRDRSGHGDDSEVVCAACRSGIGVEAETLAAARRPERGAESGQQAVTDGGTVAVEDDRVQIGVAFGERPPAARARAAVLDWVEQHGPPSSAAAVMGELGISPRHREVVEEALAGITEPKPEPVYGKGKGPPADYELEAIRKPDGTEEPAAAGGGGVETVALELPEERLLRETRLQYADGGVKIVCEDDSDRFATYDPETAAGWLVNKGYRRPWHAELALEFVQFDGELREVLKTPVAESPVERQENTQEAGG
jgi:hypothetical protein